MSFLKDFLKRREENLRKQKQGKPQSKAEEKPVLTDEMFWDIVNLYLKQIKANPYVDKAEVLSEILAQYPDEIIVAFGKRFEELNK